jgi:hypothetical protein
LTWWWQWRSVTRVLQDIHRGKMLRKAVLAFSLELSFQSIGLALAANPSQCALLRADQVIQ